MNQVEKQKELMKKKDWESVANLGMIAKNTHCNGDPIYSYAVSMLVEKAMRKGEYPRAFELADKYRDSGWCPEFVLADLKRDYGLDGKADELFQQYQRAKQSKSQACQASQT